MKFTYTYRSSDGQRHAAEIEAESRDEAFAKVRTELGIKPIKVVAAIMLIAAGGVAWWLAAHLARAPSQEVSSPAAQTALDSAPYQVMTPHGAVTLSLATPLPRQAIPGDRRKIDEAVAQERDPPVFRFAAERWLARFAEPGRRPPATGRAPVPDAAKMAAPHAGNSLAASRAGNFPAGAVALVATDGGDGSPSRPSAADFEAALREPIRIASTDFTELVDLKRIVTGMKRELRAYIAGGGTVEQYLAELEKRQRLEISYRDNAERRLNDILNGQDARSPKDDGRSPPLGEAASRRFTETGVSPVTSPNTLKAAYAYWLKANAQLQAMGIYPLSLPDALRSYQMSLDIEE